MSKVKLASIYSDTTPTLTRNIVNVVYEEGPGPQIACFAHTLNLASQKDMAVNQVSRLLGKIRRAVSFFHRSTVLEGNV